MLRIVFPIRKNQRYYPIHFEYLLNIFKYTNCEISYYDREDDNIIVKIEGKEFDFNYWDDSAKFTSNLPTFKFHCVENYENIFPFTPVSFHDWSLYYKLKEEIKYNARGIVTCRQRPYANALSRRSYVQRLLREKLEENFSCKTLEYQLFLKDINNCLVNICIPGFCNNMTDRGQLQYMALGCCTISPYLPEIFPFHKKLEAGIHYLRCNDKYTDLVELIDWCKENREKCIEIGENAKKFFEETSTPNKLIEWIKEKI